MRRRTRGGSLWQTWACDCPHAPCLSDDASLCCAVAPRRVRRPDAVRRLRAPPSAPTVDVVELSATDARARMAAGTLTSRALTQAYLDRIAAIDDAGPQLNAVIEINPTALAGCRRARRASGKAGKVRGPLHGIPVLIKDNIDAAGMVNSAGSLALADNRPKQDAFIVARLRAAGAVILGKTNLSEWANFRSTRSTSGWSSRGGQTKNPYVLDRNPCGSSAGHRHRDRRQPGADRRRHRDRRQHHLPGVGQRPRRSEADGRSGQPARHHPDLRSRRTRPGRWRAPSPTSRC